MVRLEKNDPLMLARQLPLKTVALILAGGRGTRLKDLTIKRAKPAVHFGGKFRIIDFALSNCLNSGIRRIGVITQYQSHTLVQHIQRGWSFFSEEMNEFVDLLPAQQRVHGDACRWRRQDYRLCRKTGESANHAGRRHQIARQHGDLCL